jgi:hypothetical protein
MEYYFDTSSLVALARYFSPFDRSASLYNFIQGKYVSREIVVLDVVFREAQRTSRRIVLDTFPFIEEKKDLIVNTADLMPVSPRRFSNMVNNNFVHTAMVRNGNIDFSILKQEFLNSGDGKLIMTMYNRLHDDKNAEICIVSEESPAYNDRKVFKKIPVLCEQIHARCITLVDYLLSTSLQLSFTD